jgi:dTDP-4-amino-4,6-dideoxygalactose transaminase
VRTPQRETLAAELQAQGVQTGIHYPVPVHLQKAYADPQYQAGHFPNAEKAAAEVLSLPMFPELTGAQIEAVGAAVRNATASSGRGVVA